ncbi:hypothetical protein AAFB98_000178 [Enterococcus faecalis]
MSATKEQLELFLFYLSETHTKSLSLHDLVTSRPRPEEARILLNINEVFTYYHSARVLYTSVPALENNKSEPFFQAFENFYFELKQHFFNEEDETHQLNERLEEMKIAFEQLTDDHNVL